MTRWSLPWVAAHLTGQEIVFVSPAHLGRVLAEANLSFQRTRTRKASEHRNRRLIAAENRHRIAA